MLYKVLSVEEHYQSLSNTAKRKPIKLSVYTESMILQNYFYHKYMFKTASMFEIVSICTFRFTVDLYLTIQHQHIAEPVFEGVVVS